MARYTVVINERLEGLNDYIAACRKNPHAGGEMKRKTQKRCIAYIKRSLQGVTIKRPVKMSYTWYEPNRRRDKDNVSAYGRKIIQDALVACGVLNNDGWGDITGFTDAFEIDRHNPRVEVVIEEQ